MPTPQFQIGPEGIGLKALMLNMLPVPVFATLPLLTQFGRWKVPGGRFRFPGSKLEPGRRRKIRTRFPQADRADRPASEKSLRKIVQTTHFGHGPCPKVWSLQPNWGVIPLPSCPLCPAQLPLLSGIFSVAKVIAKVSYRVICVFHARVTFP